MKEELEILKIELNNKFHDLLKIDSEIHIPSDSILSFESHIEYKDCDRSCKIYPFYFSDIPKYVFEWDECPIFEIYSNDIQNQGQIIINWVLNKKKPSIIKSQFPEIILNRVAEYYENGNGIKGEFIESWEIVEKLYKLDYMNESNESDNDALKLIHEMTKLNLNESLRAGTQLSAFILSRSRRHQLKKNTPHIRIWFMGNDRIQIKSNIDSKKTHIETNAKYNEVLSDLVNKLLIEKIN